MPDAERDERSSGEHDKRSAADPEGAPPAPAATSRSPEKRRLPVLQSSGEPPEEERPPWHWVPLGAFATFLVWLPLSVLTERVVRHFMDAAEARGEHLEAAGVWILSGHALAFSMGAVAAGVLVGRLGTKVGRREAALGGALAGLLAWLIATAQGTPGGPLVWGLLVVIIASLGAAAGALGGSLGRRWKRRSKPETP